MQVNTKSWDTFKVNQGFQGSKEFQGSKAKRIRPYRGYRLACVSISLTGYRLVPTGSNLPHDNEAITI